MYTEHPYLGRAFALSLILHAAAIAVGVQFETPAPREPARSDLTVWMRDRLAVPDAAPAQPPLLLPRDRPRNPNAAAPAASQPASPPRLTGEAALRAAEQLQRDLPYPPEAIERGLQGEALVLLFLDTSGNAIAARLESSSGHALLDDAAVRAARTLRALPASAPREALLPVRFRLR